MQLLLVLHTELTYCTRNTSTHTPTLCTFQFSLASQKKVQITHTYTQLRTMLLNFKYHALCYNYMTCRHFESFVSSTTTYVNSFNCHLIGCPAFFFFSSSSSSSSPSSFFLFLLLLLLLFLLLLLLLLLSFQLFLLLLLPLPSLLYLSSSYFSCKFNLQPSP